MAETKESASTRFPFINLEKAIGRAQELFAADQRGREMSNAGAFTIWSYSEKSSGGFQTVAALKSYGLINTPSSGKIALTENALRYFRHEDEAEKKALLSKFALSPALIAVLWKDWHASPPADTLARSHLKADRHLNDQAARTLLTIYKDNIAFADIKGDAIVEVPLEEWEEPANVGNGGSKPPPAAASGTGQQGPKNMERERAVMTEELESPTHVVRVIVAGAVDEHVLEALEGYVAKARKRMKAANSN